MKAWNMEQPLEWLVRKINETHAESGEGNRRRWKIEKGKVLRFGFRL